MRTVLSLYRERKFVSEFLAKWLEIGNILQADSVDTTLFSETKSWLSGRAYRMQSLLDGAAMVYAEYEPMLRVMRRFQLVIQTLSEMNRVDCFRDAETARVYVQTVNALEFYLGKIDDQYGKSKWQLINPFYWFYLLVYVVLMLPVSALEAGGVIGGSTASRIEGYWAFKAVNLVGSVCSIFFFLLYLRSQIPIVANTWDRLYNITVGLF